MPAPLLPPPLVRFFPPRVLSASVVLRLPTWGAALLVCLLAAALVSVDANAATDPFGLATAPAQALTAQGRSSFDGVVEAVRQTTIAAQVPGAVVDLPVKVGDRVQAGQLLLRIALDQAEAQFKAARAQVAAQVAQAGAARTQTGLHTVRAPYAGVVSEVPVQLGDMAMPGRALVTLYDPGALRVTAAVPQSVLGASGATGVLNEAVRVELPGLRSAQQWPAAARVQLLPTVDAATHTVQIRADLPATLTGVAPGMFARVWLPVAGMGAGGAAGQGPRVTVPVSAVVRRAEMTGVYVQGEGGKPQLRQVRLGRVDGDRVEVLTGVAPGDPVVVDPQAAVRAKSQ